MKKTLRLFMFFACVSAGLFFTNCNNQPATNTEEVKVDTPATVVAVDTAAGEVKTMSPTDWSVIIVVEDANHSPIQGATAKLKKMPGDTECTVDMTMTTDINGEAKFTGTGSCPCKKFRAGAQTGTCTKSKDNVVCEETVTFTCP